MKQWWSDVRMRYFDPLNEPWAFVRRRPFHFLSWLLVVPGVGLVGFWLPLFIVWARGGEVATLASHLLSAGIAASVCVAILAEGILAVFTAEKAGTNVPALGLRGIAGGLATLLIILLVGVMVAENETPVGPSLSSTVHLLLSGFALFVAAYLYCFRTSMWEDAVRDVSEAKEAEEQDINNLGSTAIAQSAEGDVRL